MALAGPYLAGCILLVVAGCIKTARPADTARALVELTGSRIGSGQAREVVRVLAAGEAAVGVAGLLLPGTVTAVLVSLSYAAFTAVVAVARRRGGPLATCGCFGQPDTPPTRTHLVLTVVVATSAASVAVTAVTEASPLWTYLRHQPWHGVPLVAEALVIAWLSWMAMTSLARLRSVA